MSMVVQSKEAIKGTFWGATFLVSGTCIGGGMLAMPVQTAEAGFLITAVALLACWMLMTYTGLCLVESTLWHKNNTHFSSLAENLLGKGGRFVAAFVYLMMNYLSLIAYTSGGAKLLDSWCKDIFGISIGYETSCAVFVVLFGAMVFAGAHFVGKINGYLMIFMILAYGALVGFGTPYIQSQFIHSRLPWNQGWGILSMILATYSYQMVVPTVCSYMHYDTEKLRKAIIFGTTLPFIIYLIWTMIVHGVIPLEGKNGLREAYDAGLSATTPLSYRLKNPILRVIADGFAFIAVVTSFLGLSLALFNFLEDLFRSFNRRLSKRNILLLTFIPTIILAILFPRALIQFLDISGGFGDTILSCAIPVGMVWVGRYRRKLTGEYRVPGGKFGLILAIGFAMSVFLFECFKLIP